MIEFQAQERRKEPSLKSLNLLKSSGDPFIQKPYPRMPQITGPQFRIRRTLSIPKQINLLFQGLFDKNVINHGAIASPIETGKTMTLLTAKV